MLMQGWNVFKMSGDMENLETKILPFLSLTARLDLKTLAVQHVSGVTASAEGCLVLYKGEKYIQALIQLTADEDTKVQKSTFDALVNMTAITECCKKVLNCAEKTETDNFLKTWLDLLHDKNYPLADSVCQLLTNLSRSESSAIAILGELKNSNSSVERLVTILSTVNYNAQADLHYLASFIANLTQLLVVRQELMDSNKRTLQKLAVFVDYQPSEVRRRGAVAALRNCSFDSDCHTWLLSDRVDVLPRLLLPLAGPEEFDEDDMEKLPEDLQYLPPDKQRETCPDIRKMLVEAIIQLCNTKPGRQYVKEKNTYVIMREIYNWESDKSCQDTMHDLIDILIGDEPPPEHETLKDIDVPSNITERFQKQDIERVKEAT